MSYNFFLNLELTLAAKNTDLKKTYLICPSAGKWWEISYNDEMWSSGEKYK